MQQRTNYSNTNTKQNKGFTVHVGETYVGYLVIGEKNVPAATVESLSKPENMKAVLSKADLRVFKDPEEADMSAVDAIIAEASVPAEEDTAGAEASS